MTPFNPKQLQCIDLLATGEFKQNKISEMIDISEATISGWKKDNNFIEAIIIRTRELLRISLPEVYNVTKNKAISEGNPQHIKILLEHIERLEAIKANNPETSITFKWNI